MIKLLVLLFIKTIIDNKNIIPKFLEYKTMTRLCAVIFVLVYKL